jgi:hypothetical protein
MDNRGGLPAGNRGGTSLYHDNTVIGVSPLGICNFTCNRTGYLRATPVWGLSDGTSVWDENDTEGNGTFVEGHPPHLFESGTASETTAEGTLTDTTKNWPTNHWVGYMVRQVNPGGVELASYIKSNTATTITYALFSWGNNHMIFNSGMGYQMISFSCGSRFFANVLLVESFARFQGRWPVECGPREWECRDNEARRVRSLESIRP